MSDNFHAYPLKQSLSCLHYLQYVDQYPNLRAFPLLQALSFLHYLQRLSVYYLSCLLSSSLSLFFPLSSAPQCLLSCFPSSSLSLFFIIFKTFMSPRFTSTLHTLILALFHILDPLHKLYVPLLHLFLSAHSVSLLTLFHSLSCYVF